ncbi:MAG: hypothetical protein HRT89_20780, partial [Lentisphaeria bacterium]|nr:hypothetical protein [Lentisphaeria bacterium]NQZ70495.1 hypothetical protein [Lentisphaeria bacterium]
MNTDRETNFILNAAAFIFCMIVFYTIAFLIALYVFPKNESGFSAVKKAGGGGKPPKKNPGSPHIQPEPNYTSRRSQDFFKRFKRDYKSAQDFKKPTMGKDVKIYKKLYSKKGGGSGGGGPGSLYRESRIQDLQQLNKRQSGINQLILRFGYNLSEEDADDNFSKIQSNSKWGKYEALRFKTRMLGEKFDLTKDLSIVDNYWKVAKQTDHPDFVTFEDYFWISHAAIFSGRKKEANKYLIKAYNSWPTTDSMFGYVYLLLMASNAIQN